MRKLTNREWNWVVVLGIVVYVALCLSGCSIPIKVTIKKDPIDVAEENRRIEEMRDIEKETEFLNKREREIILSSFSSSKFILEAFEKININMFDLAGLLNEYGKNDFEGFCVYLKGDDKKHVRAKYPFDKAYWWLDREVFIPARRNYELLKRLEQK
jgi:hypothetical protein